MTARRFTDKPGLDPGAVWGLAPDHPAMTGNRTLFPSTVVTVDEDFDDRLLISGRENRKLGETIAKGQFKGYALYSLSLEERATCPLDCDARSFCYGNAMQLARRHRIGDLGLFETLLEDEISEILNAEAHGLMVRLHVLGDFPSVEYVEMWARLLDAHPKLACYGYTHHSPLTEVYEAIYATKTAWPNRFRIRWSGTWARQDGAMVVDKLPKAARTPAGIVCPAQTDATACCASCGLCWEPSAIKENIIFIKHGPKSQEVKAEQLRSKAPGGLRSIVPVGLSSAIKPMPLTQSAPTARMVSPTALLIEEAYQRDLTGKSIKLIERIVANWDWAKFKPPVCAETAKGLLVIDGQHTAIAAASHPGIKEIMVVVVAAASIEDRAAAFVAHNRDRLVMTQAQIFYGDVAAGDKAAGEIDAIVRRTGASVPRVPQNKRGQKPGQIMAIGELRDIHAAYNPAFLERVLRIAVASGATPISKTILRALRISLTEKAYREVASQPDAVLAGALRGFGGGFERAAEDHAARLGTSKYYAAANLIAEFVKDREAART